MSWAFKFQLERAQHDCFMYVWTCCYLAAVSFYSFSQLGDRQHLWTIKKKTLKKTLIFGTYLQQWVSLEIRMSWGRECCLIFALISRRSCLRPLVRATAVEIERVKHRIFEWTPTIIVSSSLGKFKYLEENRHISSAWSLAVLKISATR